MTRVAFLGAAAAGLGATFIMLQDDVTPLLRSGMELMAVFGVFGLICAAEAAN